MRLSSSMPCPIAGHPEHFTFSRLITKPSHPLPVSKRTAWTRPPCSRRLEHWAARRRTTIVIGCEVENIDEGMGLSAPVGAAVPRAVAALNEVLVDLAARTTAPAEG